MWLVVTKVPRYDVDKYLFFFLYSRMRVYKGNSERATQSQEMYELAAAKVLEKKMQYSES